MKKAACYSLWIVIAFFAVGIAVGAYVLPMVFKKKAV